MKTKIILVLAIILFQLCNAQPTQTVLPIVENHLEGDLDYTHEAIELVQRQNNCVGISLGKINKDDTVLFNLPEFNIKALYDSIPRKPSPLQNRSFMGCKDKDASLETTSDTIYSLKINAI